MIMDLLAVGLGSALGGVCRFYLTAWLDQRTGTPLSLGTLTVNITGACLLGLLVGAAGTATGRPMVATLTMTGFCGSFTTVSSWALQTVTLARAHRLTAAIVNVLITLVAGLGAVALGLVMAGVTG